ncbi:MAG: Mut7-C RNAse domain-containing protein [Halorhabdus sp.]
MCSRRFLLDVMMGKLVTYLRMCGYDAAYALDRDIEADERLLDIACAEQRTLVTRDRHLAGSAPDSLLVESTDVRAQLRELAAAGVSLRLAETPTRCGRCNGPLDAVSPAEPTPEYAPDPTAMAVWQCRDCGQYFWKGSHWEDVETTLADV